MTEGQSWAGLTTTNHLGAIYQAAPQVASKVMSQIHQTNFGLNLDTYLNKFSPIYLDTDDDFTWELNSRTRQPRKSNESGYANEK